MMTKKTINEIRLKENRNDGVEVICWGDVHLGNRTCDFQKALGYLKHAAEKGQYVLGMGDYMEAVLPTSKGDIFEQGVSPDEQMETIIEALRPLAEKKLIIGLHRGN